MNPKGEEKKNVGGRYAFTARKLCYAAVGVAVCTVCSWISLPLGSIPFTLQTFAFCFMAGLLGVKISLFAAIAYLVLGFIGVPVFSSFTGGVEKLLMPTGGYLVGFLPLTVLTALFGKSKKLWVRLLGAMLALAAFYVCGTLWFAVLAYNGLTLSGVMSALTVCVLPFLPADICKLLLSVWLADKLKKHIKTGA